jgi:hypothetical protein
MWRMPPRHPHRLQYTARFGSIATHIVGRRVEMVSRRLNSRRLIGRDGMGRARPIVDHLWPLRRFDDRIGPG